MGPAKNNLAEFGGRKAPKPQKTRKFHFFFSQNPAILGIASRKRVIFDQVTLCFVTVSDFFSQKNALDAVPVHFFRFFRNCQGFGGASMRTAAALHCRGAGHDMADFGVIWGPIFFDQKSIFFNFDFDKKWFGGGLDPLLPAEKGQFLTELPYVLPLFLAFSRQKSQLDAVPAHFCSIFSKLSGIWRGINAHRRCPALQGGRA